MFLNVQRIVTRCIFSILMILLPSLILPAIVIDSTSSPNLPLMYLPSGDATYSDSVSSVHNKQLENVQNIVSSFTIYMLFSNVSNDLQYSSHICNWREIYPNI